MFLVIKDCEKSTQVPVILSYLLNFKAMPLSAQAASEKRHKCPVSQALAA